LLAHAMFFTSFILYPFSYMPQSSHMQLATTITIGIGMSFETLILTHEIDSLTQSFHIEYFRNFGYCSREKLSKIINGLKEKFAFLVFFLSMC